MKSFLKPTKKNITSISIVLILLFASYFAYDEYIIKEYNKVTHISVAQVKKIAELSSLKIPLTATTQATSDTTFIKRFVTADIAANIYLSTDISSINIIKDDSDKTVVIYMESPKVTAVDVTKFTVIKSQEKTFGIIPRLGYINTDIRDTATSKAMMNGKQKLVDTASSKQYIDQAKAKILETMQSLFKNVGWSVSIKWI